MDHTMLIPTCRIKLWFGFIVSFLFCYLLLENFDWYTSSSSSSSFTSFSVEETHARTVHSLDSGTKADNDGNKSNKQRNPSRSDGLKDSNPAISGSGTDDDDEIDWIKDVGQLQALEKELEPILLQDDGNRHGRKQEEEDEDEDDDEEDEDVLDNNVDNNRHDQVRQVSHSKHLNSGKNSADSSSKVVDSSSDVCSGRYIYVHQLPTVFNDDILRNCQALSKWNDMCQYVKNMGLGPDLGNPQRAFLPTGWFSTNQFFLEVIFHNRMKQYECLTRNSSKASAVFVPYYAGLDVVRYLWGSNITTRDSASLELAKWLKKQPEWKVMSGGDHFLVAGRITWDFRRTVDKDSGWGNKLMILPEFKNATILTIESSPWHSNDFAIPYPTYFHPSHDAEIEQWQNKVRKQRRKMLFSFAGAPRPNIEDSIRNEIMEQCSAAKRKCKLLECTNERNKCEKPLYLIRLFENSVFCLQPPGDSFTRRSTFDSILAGCIPVFFTPASAYVQYLWHLPKDYERYSVLIPEDDIKESKVSIDKILSQIPRRRVNAMREEVIRLIPKVIYADPRSKLEKYEDAFDLSVKGVLERVKTLRKNSSSFRFEAESSWKYFLFGITKEHEWDHFFRRTNRGRY